MRCRTPSSIALPVLGMLLSLINIGLISTLHSNPDSICSLKALHDLTKARKLFMPNPLDRFLMLMSNASRKNKYVSLAFANSGANQLVDSLEAGRFDTASIDTSSASWRARTCLDVRLILLDAET